MTEQLKKDWVHDPEKLLKISAGALVIVGFLATCLHCMLLIVLGSLPELQQQILAWVYYTSVLLWPILVAIICVIFVAIVVFFRVVKSGAEEQALKTGGTIELSKITKVILIIIFIVILMVPLLILLTAIR